MKLLTLFSISFFTPIAHSEVLDKVTTPQSSLLMLAFLLCVFLLLAKFRKSWIFWPYVAVLSFLILGNADFIFNDEVFHMASREHGGPGYMAYIYFELLFNILMLILSFVLYFKKKRIRD